jgi:nucleotide-binding universal stress UspA family protein
MQSAGTEGVRLDESAANRDSGWRTIGRWLVGSVADAIIERTAVPLLLVNPLD